MSQNIVEDRLIGVREVLNLVGFRSRTTLSLHQKIDPSFPRPVRLCGRTVRYRQSEIANWIQQLPHDRDPKEI
jgi:predicted DNA-binding transcriptional regulator AlpA